MKIRLAIWLISILGFALPAFAHTSANVAEASVYQQLQNKLITLKNSYLHLLREAEALEGRVLDVATVCEGRLTVVSGNPASATDQTNQSTIYFTPYKGNNIGLYNGTTWGISSFSEISLTLSGLTAGKNYDVFVYHTGTQHALELTAWTDDVTRATALLDQNGVYVQTGATTRRYVGTIRATSANQTQDSMTQRFVWNYQNRLRRTIGVFDGTDSWTYATDAWRSTRNSNSNRIEFVIGLAEAAVEAQTLSIITNAAGTVNYYSSGVGLDTTTNVSSSIRGSGSSSTMVNQVWSEYRGYPGVGYHYLQWVERAHASSITIWGDNGDSTRYESGVLGLLDG